ncbi:hypothetical protein GIB67_010505 [Kingdonia uniflora]|uniref:Uncharacterized protein n=1 Tax=Kingdonia uniflora TaxID=39325 RepID=A0A7J7MAL2_9MAGN|nr:hypothetical protein GIB67_010505 [Kingdonia uniflora]
MFGIHQRKQARVNEDGDTLVDQYEVGGKKYHASLNEHATLSPNGHDTMPIRAESCGLDKKIKALNDELHNLMEDKDKKFEANIKLREALKEKTGGYNLLRESIDQMKEDMQLKHVLDKQCALAYADLPGQLDANPMTGINLAKNYDDLLSAHEELKKKLIGKEDFILNWTSKYKKDATRVIEETNDHRKKLVNAEEMKKSLEVNNNEWVVVFINHTEAYTFSPLFLARKRNTTSNEERFPNLLMDTISTLFYGPANLEIPPAFVKEQLTRYFDVRVKTFKALVGEHNVKGYRVNDLIAVGLSTIK